MLKSALTVGLWTLVSRLFGFARDILIADRLGAGLVADAFFVALRLPDLFRRLFGEGAFSAAFVPAFAGAVAAEGEKAARRFAEEVMSVMLVWLGLFTLAGVLFMPALLLVLAPGFTEIPGKFALAVRLTRITFPYLMLISLTAAFASMLNGLNRFAAAAAAPILFNICLIAALLFLTPYVPTAGHALAYGVTASGIAQLALLAFACKRAGMPLRLHRPRLTPSVRLLMRRIGPGVVGVGVTQINLAVDTIVASLLRPGSVSVLYYAARVNQLPLGVIGVAAGTALLPLLSRQVLTGQRLSAHRTLNRAIESTFALTLPAAVGLAVVAEPIIRVLFERGAFGGADVTATAAALIAYAVGVPGTVLAKVLAPGFFARGDTATPVGVGVAALIVNIIFILILVVPLGPTGIALAASISALFNAAALAWLLARRHMLSFDRTLRRRMPRITAAAAGMGVVLWLVMERLPEVSGVPGWVRLGVIILAGALTYGVLGQVLAAFDLRNLGRRFARGRG
ncbi:MAG: murein biosynthesis integral membrane protein MurJ [Acetobacteraceae bacterium]